MNRLKDKFEPIHILYIFSMLIVGGLYLITLEETFKLILVSMVSFFFGKVGGKNGN